MDAARGCKEGGHIIGNGAVRDLHRFELDVRLYSRADLWVDEHGQARNSDAALDRQIVSGARVGPAVLRPRKIGAGPMEGWKGLAESFWLI